MIDIICHGCRATGSVNRVTAGLRCACGSTDIDLLDPAELTFLEFMGAAHGPGTGWGATMPDPLKGWSAYPGPMPGKNPRVAPAGPDRCGNCHGSGRSKEGKCRACFGTGHRTPTTSVSPEPLVAKHPGQTSTPFMGQRKRAAPQKMETPFDRPAPGRELHTPEDVIRHSTPGWKSSPDAAPSTMQNVSPHLKTRDDAASAEKYSDKSLRERRTVGYPMHEAECPQCGAAPTHLVNDYKDDAWWHCRNCGPLINIDRNPHVDPYNPPDDFRAKPKQFSSTPPKTGRVQPEEHGVVLEMVGSVVQTNPGLTFQESLGIVRATVQKYAG